MIHGSRATTGRLGLLYLALQITACDSPRSAPQGQFDTTTTGATSNEPLVASVVVSGSEPLSVSPHFFGQNYWSWVPEWGDPVSSVEDRTAALGLGLLRAGGANNDQQEPAPFSLAEVDGFVEFAEAIGAEPLLQVPLLVNLEGAPATARDAAALVEYVNQTRNYSVRYFSIGNEPDLYSEQGVQTAGYSANAFCDTYREFGEAMKAVDPDILLVGPDLSWKYQSGANDWLSPFLEACGDMVDIVAVHRYPLAPTACTEAAAYADVSDFRATLEHLKGVLEATGQSDKPLAITEANITWDGEPQTSTLAASPGTFPAGLWLADNLGVALENQLFNVSYWSLSEGWTLGFFDGATPRPALFVLELFSKHFGSDVLSVSGAPAGVSVYAGRNAPDDLTNVFVVNKTTRPLELEVDFTDLPRQEGGSFEVAPTSLLHAEFGDKGEAAVVTRYTREMSEPETLAP